MPIIQPPKIEEFVNKKVKIPKDIAQEIECYCEWAKINDINHFIVEAAKQILARDKNFKSRKS